ncbi:alpha/beta fold hydrolase [Selenomonadales bacterium OttesenSCG-928-I06]|nr:alpha/beta fold hydrolase [Selenomonadales bacterium OttesenSCG-928-I06]
MPIISGAEPFLFSGGKTGILLVHGFTGSPAELRPLGEYLNKQGYTVLAPRLTGHGSSILEMIQTSWPHWYGSVEDAYHILNHLCDRIIIIGFSLGAILSLKLSIFHKVSKIVALSAPIYIADKRIKIMPFIKAFQGFVPKATKKPSETSEDMAKYLIGYDQVPVPCSISVLELIDDVKVLLPKVTAPILIIQAKGEHTVKPESAEFIYNNVSSADKHLHWLEESGHVITLDVEKDHVFELIGDFLAKE